MVLKQARQHAMVAAFTQVIEDTDVQLEYDGDKTWFSNDYSVQDILSMMSEYLKKYDRHMSIVEITLAFDIEIDYDEAKDALEAQGSVHEAIVEICKLRNIGGV